MSRGSLEAGLAAPSADRRGLGAGSLRAFRWRPIGWPPRGRYAAVLCLGAVIRGETSHDRYIAQAVAPGIEAVGRARGLPVLFGVLTCDTLAQALARAGGSAADGFAGNKGAEAAAAAAR